VGYLGKKTRPSGKQKVELRRAGSEKENTGEEREKTLPQWAGLVPQGKIEKEGRSRAKERTSRCPNTHPENGIGGKSGCL